MIAKQPKLKTCKNPACGISFPPQRLGQAVCSPKCGLAIKDVNQEKARKSLAQICLLYTSPSPRDATLSRMPSSA